MDFMKGFSIILICLTGLLIGPFDWLICLSSLLICHPESFRKAPDNCLNDCGRDRRDSDNVLKYSEKGFV
jgi:hypothetical protein